MPRNCTPERRDRLSQLGRALDILPSVRATGVYDDVDGQVALEVTVAPDHDRIPPRVLAVISNERFGISDVTPRGEPAHYTAVVR